MSFTRFCYQVQCAIDGLRESAASRTTSLQQEMSIMQDTTCSIKAEWTRYMESAESHYIDDTVSVEIGKNDMDDILYKWLVSHVFVHKL